MPKAKPSFNGKPAVISHRIELQETERDVLKTYLAVNSATNAVRAVGTLIAPFTGLLAAAGAAYLAAYTVEEISENADAAISQTQQYYARNATEKYQEFTAILQTKTWDDFKPEPANVDRVRELVTQIRDFIDSISHLPTAKQLSRQIAAFGSNFIGREQAIDSAIQQGWTPSEAWSNFYGIQEVVNDAVYQRGFIVNTIDYFARFGTIGGWFDIFGGN